MKKNTITNPLDILGLTSGKFTSVTYTNGQNHTKNYTVRTGVKRYLRGGGRKKVENAIVVYCVNSNNKGYKTFKQSGISKIRCGSLTFRKKN